MSINLSGNIIRDTGIILRFTLKWGEGVIITSLRPTLVIFDSHGYFLQTPFYRINLLEIPLEYIAKIERIIHGWKTLWQEEAER